METISHTYTPAIDPAQQVIEENAIRKLEHYYVVAVDLRDFASLSKVFTKDVVADYGPGIGVINGVETLSKTLEQMTSPVLSQHLIGTQVITLTTPTSANAITYVVANQFGKGAKEGIPLYAFPRYEDKLVKGEDGWKITHRNLHYMGPHTGDISIFGI